MKVDHIELKLPAKPEYILVVRLTTSAIATRAGFGVDEIEDIKVAVAEAGNAIINQGMEMECLNFMYEIEGNTGLRIHITVSCPQDKPFSQPDVVQNELSLYIIESLMDEVSTQVSDGRLLGVTMYKKFGG